MPNYDDAKARELFREQWQPEDDSFVRHEKANFDHVWLAGEEDRLAELMLLVQVGWDATSNDRCEEAWKPKQAELASESGNRFNAAWQRHCETTETEPPPG